MRHSEEEFGYDLHNPRISESLYSHLPAKPYYEYDHYSNEMTAKSFPTVKPQSYNPEKLAESLEKSHQAGRIAPPEEDIPLHGPAHR